MALGGFFGLLEEVIPLVPIMIALAYSLGWDSLTGLGFSILAANVGFSTAVFNFFTIGITQQLAGLPLFSGWVPRLVLFLAVYALLGVFLSRYARKGESEPQRSLVYAEDSQNRPLSTPLRWFQQIVPTPNRNKPLFSWRFTLA